MLALLVGNLLFPASVAAQDDLANVGKLTQEYILGPGDQLVVFDQSHVNEAGEPLSSLATVLPDGSASIYPFGSVRVAGLTILQLNKDLDRRSEQMYHQPRIILSLAAMRPVTVYVLGAVQNPGRYSASADNAAPLAGPARTGLTGPFTGGALTGMVQENEVRDEDNSKQHPSITALTAIQLAGGVRENADIHNVVVRRSSTSTEKTYDLWKLLVEGDARQDVSLYPGDSVVVPVGGKAFNATLLGKAANNSRPVRVFGAVEKPGIYDLTPNDDLLSVIARAGGFLSTASQRSVLLSRVDRDGQFLTTKVSINKSMKNEGYIGRYPIQPGDAVYVKSSLLKRIGPRAGTIAAAFASAFMILYFSRVIVDQSQPQSNNNVSVNNNNSNNSSTSTAQTTGTN